MTTKTFTDDDQFMIFYIVENAFPLLSGKQANSKIKWLRGVIKSNHKWNGFFQNTRVASNVNVDKYHTYLLKIVSNKRKMLDTLKSGFIEDNRKRMSESLKFILWRLGHIHPKFTRIEIQTIEEIIEMNRTQLLRLYKSGDPHLMCHLFLVLGSFYTQLQKKGIFNGHSMTFYFFTDMSIKFMTANTK